MLLYYSLLFSWIIEVVLGGQAVPTDIEKKFKGAHTFEDITKMTNIMYKSKESGSRGPAIKIATGSFVSMPVRQKSSRGSEAADESDRDLSVLKDIKQGIDSCKLQSICVPVPVENANPEVVLFPKCYEIAQCIGSCCDFRESCHATAKEFLYKPVIELVYIGDNKFDMNQTINVTMEQHLACGCKNCGATQCPNGRVLGASCSCECSNQSQKSNCQGNFRWNEDDCKCECRSQICSSRQHFNEQTCACELDQTINLHQPDNSGNYKTDTSRLPSLHRRKHLGDAIARKKVEIKILQAKVGH